MSEDKIISSQVTCLVCKKGKITEKFVYEFTGHGLPIDGPGGEKQHNWVSRGLYCEQCGIKYEHLPKSEKRAYCVWGEHYVDPKDLFDDGQTAICEECQKIITFCR